MVNGLISRDLRPRCTHFRMNEFSSPGAVISSGASAESRNLLFPLVFRFLPAEKQIPHFVRNDIPARLNSFLIRLTPKPNVTIVGADNSSKAYPEGVMKRSNCVILFAMLILAFVCSAFAVEIGLPKPPVDLNPGITELEYNQPRLLGHCRSGESGRGAGWQPQGNIVCGKGRRCPGQHQD